MKRRLTVLRHAKSSWKDARDDHERPLNERGRGDAPRVAAELIERGWYPDLVLSSTSRRTRETVELLRAVWDATPAGAAATLSERYEPALYLGGPSALEALLRTLPDAVSAVLMVGHNPGCEEIVRWLTGQVVPITTANAALLEGEGAHWAEALDRRPWTLHEVIRPREL